MHRLPRTIIPQAKLRLPASSSQLSSPVAAVYQPSIQSAAGIRRYASNGKENKSSGNEEEHYHRQHDPTPDRSEPPRFSEDFDRRIPSNKARPALSDQYLHSGADPQHPKREQPGPEDVKKEEDTKKDVEKHNEDMERRYDRAYSQIDQKGEFKTLEDEVVRFRNKGE
ncbi:hypothetical protein AJ79_00918 [Helicocarpus griseus UAMH5409]|uniref:Uncharacterized protein n=1 Tax=Helicocarpus griseus UAMH5409 TaxID=1447875 RepID=A0A2B7YAZ6_9EURO|nr:hypothetical protein AJ79_00918 [Helicocarpus griseus UAMH5409]